MQHEFRGVLEVRCVSHAPLGPLAAAACCRRLLRT